MSELLDTQINAIIAEKVLGWNRGKHNIIWCDGKTPIVWIKDWRPMEYLLQAFEAAQKLIDNGYTHFELTNYSGGWECQFLSIENNIHGYAHDENVARAISLALVEAVQNVQNE